MLLKKLLFLFVFLCTTVIAYAQLDNQPVNQPKYDHEPAHAGFALGINSATFHVNRAGDLKYRDSVYSVEPNALAGLNLSILGNLRIGDNFDFRFIPTLAFVQRNLTYNFIYADSSKKEIVKQIQSTYLELPFELKFKSKRSNNYRVYVLGGMKYSIDMVSQAKVNDKDKSVVKLQRNDFGYEIGLGFDFYLPYFKFSPEIKMYNGLNNLLSKENTPFASPLDGLYAKTFTISFLFE